MISLNGEWKLHYHLEEGTMPETLEAVRALRWPCIPATVPGNVELDLFRAGAEADPFYGENIYHFRKYEFYQWWFERTFDMPARGEGRWVLQFDGVNTFAQVYVNGALAGACENMLIEHRFDVTDALRYGEENHIAVRIASAINRARTLPYEASLYGDEYTKIRIPPSSTGWDILGRFISAGMWRGVSLRREAPTRLLSAYYATKAIRDDGTAVLHVKYHYETNAPILEGFTVRVSGRCGGSAFSKEAVAYFVSGSLDIPVPQAALWYPRGYGPANLYRVRMELLRDGQVVDAREETIGLRRAEVEHRMLPGDAGAFTITVNGVPILAKGTNWVPLDALHSRDAERLRAAHDLLEDSGCNIVRCWGGNVYEDHAFFDLCDARGILVWQDFAMACAAYPADDAFCGIIEREAASVIRKLRNHPSILLWAGDNEVDETVYEFGYATDENRYNRLTREALPRAVRAHDPYRMFLPSSPYIPAGMKRYEVPEQHNWGPRAYFKDDFYKHSATHFISECGYHGCPAVSSLRRFIPEERLTPWLSNDVWDTHNTDYIRFGRRGYSRIQLMDDQVRVLAGEAPEDLARFAILSQISQAEAKKFFIERTRLLKWRRTGVIWWNLLDGWPQISDAVVDYYYAKKIAYHYIRRVQRPVCLMADEPEGWTRDVVLGNDGCWSGEVTYRVEDGETGEALLSGVCESRANENRRVGVLPAFANEKRLYLLHWTVDGVPYANHCIAGFPPYDPDTLLRWLETIRKLPEPFEIEM